MAKQFAVVQFAGTDQESVIMEGPYKRCVEYIKQNFNKSEIDSNGSDIMKWAVDDLSGHYYLTTEY